MNKLEKSLNENMGKIDYEQFLLTQLLRSGDLRDEDFNIIPYDILYTLSFDIMKMYKKQENQNISLYDDLENFIINNRNELVKMCQKYI